MWRKPVGEGAKRVTTVIAPGRFSRERVRVAQLILKETKQPVRRSHFCLGFGLVFDSLLGFVAGFVLGLGLPKLRIGHTTRMRRPLVSSPKEAAGVRRRLR